MYKLPDGRSISPGNSFEYKAILYPANWQLYTQKERENIGIKEVVEGIRPDDRFYFVSQNPDGTFSTVPKDLDQLKEQLISQVKQTANSLLASGDYKVTRSVETQEPLDEDFLAVRRVIRTNSNALEAEINALSSVEELSTWQPSGWPEAV